jgi:hypothetical protein
MTDYQRIDRDIRLLRQRIARRRQVRLVFTALGLIGLALWR